MLEKEPEKLSEKMSGASKVKVPGRREREESARRRQGAVKSVCVLWLPGSFEAIVRYLSRRPDQGPRSGPHLSILLPPRSQALAREQPSGSLTADSWRPGCKQWAAGLPGVLLRPRHWGGAGPTLGAWMGAEELNLASPGQCGFDRWRSRKGEWVEEHIPEKTNSPSCLGQETRIFSFFSLPHPWDMGSLGLFSNHVRAGFSPRPGGSLCHNHFWWLTRRQDGHAAGRGPARGTQVGVPPGCGLSPGGWRRAGGFFSAFGASGASERSALQSLAAHRFQVDFQCGCSLHPPPDIAIHFNPRFHTTQPHAICNTLQAGRWQAEARWPRLALRRGASFRILFLFGHEDMKVSARAPDPRAGVLPPVLPLRSPPWHCVQGDGGGEVPRGPRSCQAQLQAARGPGPDVSCAEAAPRLQVSVNGRHFLHYRYRLPLSRVDTLGIFGDILVKAVGFLNINVSSRGARAGVAVASDLL